ncbi:MAG: hypothetical protein HYW63_01455 [Candidatus Levybacteria bacterium]|nr:hypothetical protein [Candidatus Levybacteria bacterium]
MEKDKNTEEELVKKFDSNKKNFWWGKLTVVAILMIALGAGSGFLIVKGTAQQAGEIKEVTSASGTTKGTIFGSNDTKTFKDTAEGVLREGGIDGEGQYHLERPGGQSQNVYLTSSVVDLSLVKGKKIKVWGETFDAEKAGWLMDVGRVEVLE